MFTYLSSTNKNDKTIVSNVTTKIRLLTPLLLCEFIIILLFYPKENVNINFSMKKLKQTLACTKVERNTI